MEVFISADDKHLHGAISRDDGVERAFYIYRNDELIAKRWYSPQKSVSFEHGGVRGVYKITGFSRSEPKDITTKNSSEFFIYGPNIVEIDVATLANGPFFTKYGNHDFHCLFSRGTENRLFVLLTAAIRRGSRPLPAFNRWKWRKRFPGHVLCISDPTLAASSVLEIGWYLGSEMHDATTDMANLVKHIAQGLGVNNHSIIPYGSSAGGFAAMSLASRIPGSMAVAINPQTDATKYHPKRVTEMLTGCFPGLTLEDVRRDHASRVCMASALALGKSRVLIAQNTEDAEHWGPHFLPFAQSMGIPRKTGKSDCGQHSSIVYTHESGHASETPELFDEIIRQVVTEA